MDKQVYYRLIALWVICEAMLGGIIHGLKLPVSGLIVGGSAVICICMIANYYPVRGAIIKATIIVAIFKMMLSPHSPFAAYIAVFFQGIVGELIFLNRKKDFYKFNCILFGIIALAESGIQRILVMTIIYGRDLWEATDIFISGVTGQETITNYSYLLAASYVALHLVAGFFIGWFAAIIPKGLKENTNESYKIKFDDDPVETKVESPRKKRKKYVQFIFWLLLAGLLIHSVLFKEHSLLPSNMIFRLLFRSVLIILTWTIIINPILMKLLHRWLEKKKNTSGSEVKEISLLLPRTQFIVRKSWELSSVKRGIKRLMLFFRIVIFNSLANE